MRVVIDRFEGDFAVCEKQDRTMMNIKRNLLPSEAKAGDVININDDVITIDTEETKRRKREIEDLIKGLWN